MQPTILVITFIGLTTGAFTAQYLGSCNFMSAAEASFHYFTALAAVYFHQKFIKNA